MDYKNAGWERAMMERLITRFGKSVEPDEAFDAWTQGDLPRMLLAVELKTNLIDRHYLLQGIVERAYKRRSEAGMRSTMYRVAELHMAELPKIAPALLDDLGHELLNSQLPTISTFWHYMRAKCEDGDFGAAEKACAIAAAIGIDVRHTYEGMRKRAERKIAKERGEVGRSRPRTQR